MAHSSVVPYRGGGPGGRLAWQLAAWKERIMRHGFAVAGLSTVNYDEPKNANVMLVMQLAMQC